MNELNPGSGDVAPEAPAVVRPDAEIEAAGEAQAAVVHDLEASHALAEDPERRCADIKIWVEAECDYFGIEPKNDPVADQITQILFDHEVGQLERGRAEYDVTTDEPRRLNRVIERGLVEVEEVGMVETEAEETAAIASTAEEIEAEQRSENEKTEEQAEITEGEEASADSYREAVKEIAGQPNTEKIQTLIADERVPETYKEQLRAFCPSSGFLEPMAA
jgi:hypothetical protein